MTDAQIVAAATALYVEQSGLGPETFESYRLRDRYIADARACVEAAAATPPSDAGSTTREGGEGVRLADELDKLSSSHRPLLTAAANELRRLAATLHPSPEAPAIVKEAGEVADRSLDAMQRRSRRGHGDVAPAIDWTPSKDAIGAYRVGHSEPPHLADGMTASVCMGDGAFSTIPNPRSYDTGGIVWHLTYALDVLPYVLTAGSIITSFDYLLSGSLTMKGATRRLRLMRSARAALSESNAGEGA